MDQTEWRSCMGALYCNSHTFAQPCTRVQKNILTVKLSRRMSHARPADAFFEGGIRVRRGGGDHPRNSTIVSAVLSSSVFTVSSSSSSSSYSEVAGFLELQIVYYDARLPSICKSAVQQTKNPLTQGFLLPQIMFIMERHLGREGQWHYVHGGYTIIMQVLQVSSSFNKVLSCLAD